MKVVSHLFNIAQIELVYKLLRSPADYPIVNDPLIAFQILRSVWDDNKIDLVEQFKIILLDKNKACLGVAEVSAGGFNNTSADPKVIFTAALLGRASSIILAHNHTSDKLEPSVADEIQTLRLIDCGRALDIKIEDHLIINRRRFLSMQEVGLIP